MIEQYEFDNAYNISGAAIKLPELVLCQQLS